MIHRDSGLSFGRGETRTPTCKVACQYFKRQDDGNNEDIALDCLFRLPRRGRSSEDQLQVRLLLNQLARLIVP